jgi:hypothetical protein
MRIYFNNPPEALITGEDPSAGRPIRQPGRRASIWLTTLAGLILLSLSIAVTVLFFALAQRLGATGFTEKEFTASLGLLIVIPISIIAHELLHALLHPGFGFTDSTILFLDWRKLLFAAYYEGRIPRGRWIAMRLFPMFVLTCLPLGVFLILLFRATYGWETYLLVLILLNTLGSGGDLAAVAIVLRQVPPGGVLNFHRGKAYWLPAEGEGTSLRS